MFLRPADWLEAVLLPLLALAVFLLIMLAGYGIAQGIDYWVTGTVVGFENLSVISYR